RRFAATFGEGSSGRRRTTLLVESGRCSLPRQLGYHPDNRRLDHDSRRKRHDGIGCAGKGGPGRTPIHEARYRLCDLQRLSGSTASSFWIVWSLLTEFSLSKHASLTWKESWRMFSGAEGPVVRRNVSTTTSLLSPLEALGSAESLCRRTEPVHRTPSP